jgi:hypothetical protein
MNFVDPFRSLLDGDAVMISSIHFRPRAINSRAIVEYRFTRLDNTSRERRFPSEVIIVCRAICTLMEGVPAECIRVDIYG